jgi:hypothetical protein
MNLIKRYFAMPGTWTGFVCILSGVVAQQYGEDAGQVVGIVLTHFGAVLVGAPV